MEDRYRQCKRVQTEREEDLELGADCKAGRNGSQFVGGTGLQLLFHSGGVEDRGEAVGRQVKGNYAKPIMSRQPQRSCTCQ